MSCMAASMGLDCSLATVICSRKSESTWSKRLASSGSCSRMSSEPRKMDSRLHQARCTSIQSSRQARTCASLAFHWRICVSKKPMKRLPVIACSDTSWSSRASKTASGLRTTSTPVALKGSYLRASSIHAASMRASWRSILSSSRACCTVSATASLKRCSCGRRRSSSTVLLSMAKDRPQMRMSFFQWRSRIASSRRSDTRGRATMSSCTSDQRPACTPQARAALGRPFTSRSRALPWASISSTSTRAQGVARQAAKTLQASATWSQTPLRPRSSERQCAMSRHECTCRSKSSSCSERAAASASMSAMARCSASMEA
mmetsp:Transcript_4440/g.12911  ORF Transcript_4440/g.12911 Transcript_4440/m.12911 type:complete len:317 (-) Transcript_4440:707-1657(-)